MPAAAEKGHGDAVGRRHLRADRTPIVPAGRGVTCWPSTMSGFGKRSSTPSAIIACAPAPYSSAGWKTATTVPDHSSFVLHEPLERAEQRGDVHVVAARVHDGNVWPDGSTPRAVDA